MRYLLSFIFILTFNWHIYSQNTATVAYTETPLNNVFTDLEEKFNVKFSFDSELTTNRVLSLHLENAYLDEILIYISNQLFLQFSKQSERYYTVKLLRRSLTDTQQLDEIIIEEYITSGISKENDDASISLSPKKLGILPGLTEPDVLQSIQLLPGVQSPTETASGLFIRGGTPDQNLILWDGIKIYQTGHFFGTISAFNPYITDVITLFKSGTKARYESRISGVVDISSFSDIPENFEGGFGFNMTHADAYLKAPVGKNASVLVSARRSITDIFETETFRNLSNRVFQETKISNGNVVQEGDEVQNTNDLFYFTDFTIKANVKTNKNNSFELSSLYTKNKLDYGFLVEEFEEASSDILDIINQGLNLKWDHNYTDKFSQDFNFYYSNFDFSYTGINQLSGELEDQLKKVNVIDDFGFLFNLNWKLNEKSTIGSGYQFSSNQVKYHINFVEPEAPENDFSEGDEAINNTHALYFDYQFNTHKNWHLNTGLRINHFSVFDKIFLEPRLQISKYLSPNLKFKVSGERLNQVVSQVLEFNTQNFGLENLLWVLSDGEQRPILKSSQVTSGLIFDKKGWNIDLEVYYKHLDGLTGLTFGLGNSDELFARGESNVFGLDFLLKKRIKNYRTWISYSFINNDFAFNVFNNGSEFSGNNDITHNLFWSHSCEWRNFNVSLGWNFRTGIPYTDALSVENNGEGDFIVFDDVNAARLPDYHRLDASATYKFNFSKDSEWKGKIGLSLLNIYNRENTLSRTFDIKQPKTLEEEATIREVNKNSLGLTPNLVLRVEF